MRSICVTAEARFASLLVSPKLPLFLALLAVILTLPSLWVGLQFDDYLLEQSVRESSSPVSAINEMFIFMNGNAQQAHENMNVGTYPWFAVPEGRNAFWRPLSALTHWVDFRFWSHLPVLMHVENILWFALCVFLVTLLYREILPAPAAGLAALFFAVDDAHGYAVGWISNRNVLMAFSFGMLSLLLYHRYMQKAGRHKTISLIGSAAFLALSIFSAEAGMAVAGYLAAYVFVFHRSSPRKWLTLFPHLLVFCGWGYFYRLGNYGGWGTSYIDPVQEMIPFLLAVIERAPVLWLGLLSYPPAELYPFMTNLVIKILWQGAGVILLVFWGIKTYPLVRQNENLQFLLAGAIFSTLLICSSLPANRLLFFVGFGIFAVLAVFLLNVNAHVWVKRPLWFVHLFLATLLLPIMSMSPKLFGNIESAVLSAPVKPTVIIVAAPSAFHADFFRLIRTRYGAESPDRVWYLGSGVSLLQISRPSEKVLVIHAPTGYISGFDSVFRGAGHPMSEGEFVQLNGLQVTVQSLTRDGRPALVTFEFSEPLESQEYQWLIWESNRLVEWQPPEIGRRVEVR
jgi:hypothetical protein